MSRSRFFSRASVCFLAFFALFSFRQVGFCQEITGSITGVVTDSSGALIVGAKIAAVNEETGIRQETTAQANGFYRFPAMRAGRYQLIAESPGMQRIERGGVVLNTTEIVRIDFTMTVGAITESVTVSDQTPLLQSERATLGQTIEKDMLGGVPLATRNFTQILGLSAGIVSSVFDANSVGAGNMGVSVNGARAGSNNVMVEGTTSTNQLNNQSTMEASPSLEFMQQFKVLTSTFSAEYGRNLGSQIAVTTKSGTNSLHGSVYNFFRNTVLNARPFFNPERLQNNQNQYGANLGGPIVRNKTFFFGGWEGTRQINANSNAATLFAVVPTQAMRQGAFPRRIVDPLNGQPFPNNTIPAARLNRTSVNIQDRFIPLPNYVSGGAINFFAASPVRTDWDQYMARVDHYLNPTTNLYGYYFQSLLGVDQPFGRGLPGFGVNTKTNRRLATAVLNKSLRPNLLLETRFGFSETDAALVLQDQTDPTTLGLRPLATTYAVGMPRININSYVSFGNNGDWSDFVQTYSGAANFTWLKGSHTIKAGFDVMASRFNPANRLRRRGQFTYNGQATEDQYADFLLTMVRSKDFTGGDASIWMRDSNWSGYINDDWKVTQNLTLTLGLRYEYQIQPGVTSLSGTNWWHQNYTGVGSPEAAGMVRTGVNGIPKSGTYNDGNNFSPRVGLAWKPADTWVIRSGAGIYFDNRVANFAQSAFFTNPPAQRDINLDCLAPNSGCVLRQADNWTYNDASFDPNNIPFPRSPNDQITLWGLERDTVLGYAGQWNFSIQKQLPGNTLIETAYVGTKGTHLNLARNFNPLMPTPTGTLVRQYPGFASIPNYVSNNGDSIYHSFQGTVRRRWRSSSFQGAYTFSKTLSNAGEQDRQFAAMFTTPWNDWRRARGPAGFDRPHRFVLSFVQDFPNFLRSGLGRALLNNWNASGVFITQAGTPITVTNRDSGAGLGGLATSETGAFFSNVVAGAPLTYTSGSLKENLSTYINRAAWSLAPRGTWGNSGRGMFRGPGQTNLDVSLVKRIPIRERIEAQFRSEFFNLLNIANFGSPDSSLDSPSFGQIRSTTVNARLIQFALRLTF